jgi:hypothetical protein
MNVATKRKGTKCMQNPKSFEVEVPSTACTGARCGILIFCIVTSLISLEGKIVSQVNLLTPPPSVY